MVVAHTKVNHATTKHLFSTYVVQQTLKGASSSLMLEAELFYVTLRAACASFEPLVTVLRVHVAL